MTAGEPNPSLAMLIGHDSVFQPHHLSAEVDDGAFQRLRAPHDRAVVPILRDRESFDPEGEEERLAGFSASDGRQQCSK